MSIIIFLLALGILQIIGTITTRRGLKGLSCRRSFSCKEAFEGEEGQLIEVVRNDSPYLIPWARLESYTGTGLQLGRQSNVDVSNDTHYCSCFTLMPYQQIRRRHYVKFVSRGVYDLGNTAMSAGNLLGRDRFYKDLQLSTQVTVYPRLLDQEELPYPMTQVLGEMITRNRLQQDPFMIRGIRPYQPGDLIRDIHWQATARTEQVQVAVHDNTVYPRLLVVLNAQQTDNQWDNYIRQEHLPRVEEGIRLAASMCVYGLQGGLEVGFAANMPLERGGASALEMPGGGMERQDLLLHRFAQLQTHCSEKFITLLQSLRTCRDFDILVLSPYDSDGIRKAMAELEHCGNRVSFCLMEGGAQ